MTPSYRMELYHAHKHCVLRQNDARRRPFGPGTQWDKPISATDIIQCPWPQSDDWSIRFMAKMKVMNSTIGQQTAEMPRQTDRKRPMFGN